jgi:hypothetical protein
MNPSSSCCNRTDSLEYCHYGYLSLEADLACTHISFAIQRKLWNPTLHHLHLSFSFLLNQNMLSAYDSLILGSGSAGLSTALALGRLHRTCAVISNSSFRDPGLQPIHGILGHEGKTADEIRRSGRKEVEAYGHVNFVDATITKVYKEYNEASSSEVFAVESEAGDRWIGRTLVVATGSKNVFPKVPGFVENWPANM